MKQEHKRELEQIIDELKCPEDFKCYRMGFDDLCKAKDVGLQSHIECLEERPFQCKFSVAYGRAYFCHCPLRVFIAKKLKK
jgi:hypothetical protein